jgi:hypothetical protein
MGFMTYYINNRQIVKVNAYILAKFKIPGQVTNVITRNVIWLEIELDICAFLYWKNAQCSLVWVWFALGVYQRVLKGVDSCVKRLYRGSR